MTFLTGLFVQGRRDVPRIGEEPTQTFGTQPFDSRP